MANRSLQSAKTAKNDEFYTRFDDVQRELNYYKEQFKNKVVYCNCDDPAESAFAEFFKLNFDHFGLKKLVCTRYSKSDLFRQLDPVKKYGYRLEITGRNSLQKIDLKGDGDFRSPECIELLKESDIVCTNPPFSLFREYIAQLMRHNKKFLIIGPINAITYKEIFPYIKDNKMWGGYVNPKEFINPQNKIEKLGNVQWWTNLDVKKRHEELPLYEKFVPEKYPKYINYDAISVDKTAEIPSDYFDAMGVPISFLDKYNPDQFEILGISLELARPMSELAPKGTYMQGGARFYIANGDGTFERKFDRIVIKRKGKNEDSSQNHKG